MEISCHCPASVYGSWRAIVCKVPFETVASADWQTCTSISCVFVEIFSCTCSTDSNYVYTSKLIKTGTMGFHLKGGNGKKPEPSGSGYRPWRTFRFSCVSPYTCHILYSFTPMVLYISLCASLLCWGLQFLSYRLSDTLHRMIFW